MPMNSEPFISVVLPTFNGKAYISNAIESVMRQTYRNFELIVVDDGSTDETQEILEKISKRYTKLMVMRHHKNLGFVKSLNDGIENARGFFIARIDDDDVWCDEKKLEKQVTFLREHPEYGLVGGGIIRVDGKGRESGRYMFPERDEDIRAVFLTNNVVAHSAAVFRKDLWKRVGGYREEYHFFADWALWLAIGSVSKAYNFPEYFTLYFDKEQGGGYGRRDSQIRRKMKANLRLAREYQAHYPGFLRSIFSSLARYAYSFLPSRWRFSSLLFHIRVFLFGIPGYVISKKEQEYGESSPICVIGAGYVGLVTAVCFAELGNKVFCVEQNREKVEQLLKGTSPFYEPGLVALMQKHLSERRIKFTTNLKMGVNECEIIFICVGTPQLPDGNADLSQVESVVCRIGEYASSDKIVIEKGTVPVHTSKRIRELLEKSASNKQVHFSIVSNPEFLREGSAISDFLHPDRIVLGFEREEMKKDAVLALYKAIDAPKITTDIASAELIKEASNVFLAFKISFANLISRVCEKTGADIKEVAWGMGLDKRIGLSFLEAGIGYGGSCLPKDVRALQKVLEEHKIDPTLLQAIDGINESQRELFKRRIEKEVGGVRGKTIAVLGLSFKPNTDDMREAPAIPIIRGILQGGVGRIKAYDPQANKAAQSFFPNIEFSENPYEAARDADALVILTDWNEFKDLDLEKVRDLLRSPVVIDGRNIFDPLRMRALGFSYAGIGRNLHE